MNGWAGTRAERQWLAALQRIGNALERIAVELERRTDERENPEPRRKS